MGSTAQPVGPVLRVTGNAGKVAVRAAGMSLGSLTHWFFAAIISQTFPFFAKSFGGSYIFGFFAVMMVLQLLFVWKLMPETKGIALEDMGSTIRH